MSEVAGAQLNPLTLCFRDPKIERAYRRHYSVIAQRQLRRFLVFICVLSILLSQWIGYRFGLAEQAGLEPMFDMSGPSAGAIAGSIVLTLSLFAATFSKKLLPHLQWITFGCFAGLLLLDQANILKLPLSYSLTWALINLAIVYTALQLRFFAASALGVGFSLIHFAALIAVHDPWRSDTAVQLQFGINVTMIVGFNLMLMFVNHQRELHARTAYAQTALLEQHSVNLESALDSLKQAEARLIENEKQATVGRLVAGILHETNTPLGALSSATQTLKSTLKKLNGGAQQTPRTVALSEQLLDVQASSTARLGELVNELRQFVSLDQQDQRAADIRTGLRTACTLLRPQLPADVQFELVLPPDPVWVLCFPERLNQAFLNLLQNAAGAFDAESARKKLIHCTLKTENRSAVLSVQDTGRGMPEEQLKKAFELGFSQRGPRVKLRLGLPSSRRTVEEAGGSLKLTSGVQVGTTVRLELPLTAAPSAVANQPQAETPTELATLRAVAE